MSKIKGSSIVRIWSIGSVYDRNSLKAELSNGVEVWLPSKVVQQMVKHFDFTLKKKTKLEYLVDPELMVRL